MNNKNQNTEINQKRQGKERERKIDRDQSNYNTTCAIVQFLLSIPK